MDPILTVLAPAASTRLLGLAAVKAELGIAGTADDALLEGLIDRAGARIAAYLRVMPAGDAPPHLVSETVRERFRLTAATDALRLSRHPVTAIAAVTAGGTVLAAEDFETDQASGLLYRLAGGRRQPWRAPATVTVDYTAGYVPDGPSPTLPADIAGAAMALVKADWAARGRDPLAKEIDIPGVMRASYWVGGHSANGSGLPPDIEGQLAPFRRWP